MDTNQIDTDDRAGWPSLAEAIAFAERDLAELKADAFAKRLLVP